MYSFIARYSDVMLRELMTRRKRCSFRGELEGKRLYVSWNAKRAPNLRSRAFEGLAGCQKTVMGMKDEGCSILTSATLFDKNIKGKGGSECY